jgi:mRNA interferase RelE/StbE
MRYRVELRPAAQRTLDRMRGTDLRRVQGALALLAQNPRPPRAVALKGRGELRVRVGDFRIIYTVHDDVLLVLVISLGHRRDVYRSR